MRQFLAACAALALIPVAGGLQAAIANGPGVAILEAPNAPTVRSVSVVSSAGRAEIVIGVDASVEVDDFVLESPYRVVIDLKGATLTMAPNYDRLARGGVLNLRAAQFKPNVVRVVVELDAAHSYEVARKDGEVRVTVAGGSAGFSAWHSAPELAHRASTTDALPARAAASPSVETVVPAVASAAGQPDTRAAMDAPVYPSLTPDPNITSDDSPSDWPSTANSSQSLRLTPASAQSDQPRITVTYQDADIRDVIAAFAAFSGRTIVVGKDVAGTITAEIKNQPWDVALRAILQGQGLAAGEDAVSGIITVDSYKNIASKQASEPLVTQLVAVNYASAASLVPTLTNLLARDCLAGGVPEAAQNTRTSCYSRGAVAADTATNTLLITETPSRLAELLSYVKSLDIRTPQVAIKAKIIFVNRTDIEELGLSYDLGTGNDQFFSQLVQRMDPTTTKPVDTNGDGVPDAFGGGTPVNGDRVLLGGRALAAIANANARVVNPALRLVFSAALGKFQLTSFLDALQEVRLADLQAEPSIVTLDNRKAEILVGQEIPIRVLDLGTQGGQQGGGGQGNQNVPRATVQLKEVGIILSVTPHITNNRQILLKLHAENSDAQLASSDVGFIFGKQRADNQLLVGDGETAVIGGLTVTQVTSSKSGIPLLVDLPIIGRLFGTTRTSEQKRDLLILVTPHIIDEGERVLSPRASAAPRSRR
ncbi:MAG: AMIN domain-containing protein [Gemmatimonadaceae bacterium]|nr:AMIN domain-containing protein [Gemmatimonadaceae bacterium]MDQ3242744.1 AMIN domain-containing protein [Gemmatimonadota bacterium]